MKNVIVIINPKTSVDVDNIWKDVEEYKLDKTGVKTISKEAWCIDTQKSFEVLTMIVSNAKKRGLEVFAFEIDEKLIAPKEW